jgi:hypothetical protein
MGRCTAITQRGGRCTQPATGSHGLCWGHDPANADKRRRSASRAARAKALTEVKTLKAEIKTVISEVKDGDLDRSDAAVMLQGYRTLKDFVELERRVKETDELTAEIEDLKRERGGAHDDNLSA